MPWSGGTFNRANGATGWADDQAANIGIEAGRHDTQDNDFRDGINDTLNKSGQNTPTANLPMGGFRHTGAGDAVGDADYTTYGQAKAGVNIAKATTVDYTVSQYTATTAGPTVSLQKSRGASIGTNTIVANGDTLGTIQFRGANGTTFTDAAKVSAIVDGTPGASNDMPGALIFSTTSDGAGSPVERMRIDAAGKVGVGISSPSARLEVTGSDTVAGIANGIAVFRSGGAPSSDGGILLSSETGNNPTITATNLNAGAGAATSLKFVTNKLERLRIADDGRVLINTTSALGQLTATSTNNGFSPAIFNSTASGDVAQPILQLRKFDNTNTTSAIFVRFEINNGASGQGQINGNGPNQAAFGNTSDERLKENIVDLPSQFNALLALRPVEFDYKDQSGHQLGFIAQEVQQIYPDLVSENAQGFLMLSGLGKNEARLVKGFQELAAKILQLQSRIEILEGA